MGKIWEDQNKYQRWLDVELAVVETLAEEGTIPKTDAEEIRNRASFSVDRINEIEAEVKHDVIAFTTSVAEFVGPSSRFFHFGLTSSDVLDTAMALQVRDASVVIAEGLRRLLDVLKKRAHEFKTTVIVGRTHGIHAEPTTFGLKLSLLYDEVARQQARFSEAAETMRVGKLSGAVGTFAHLSPDVEEKVMAKLNLKPAPASSQVIQRDRHAHYITSLALIGATLEKIAVEVRHLQRTEVREAEEYFSSKQKGSSAMPHKRNPDHIGTDRRSRAHSAKQCGCGYGKRRALAREGYFALIRRKNYFPGFHDPCGLPARSHSDPDREARRISGSHERKSGTYPWADLFRRIAAGTRCKGRHA